MEFLFQIFAILLVIFVSCFVWQVTIRRTHPPGPLGLPVFGILPLKVIKGLLPGLFGKSTREKEFRQMKERYGAIWSMQVWGQRIITLASFDLIKEAFVDNAKLFSGRPLTESHKFLCENSGIVFIDGELWQGNRRLAARALQELGLGKGRKEDLEKRICDEANKLIKCLESSVSVPITVSTVLVKAVSSVMARLTLNECNQYDDCKLMSYVEKMSNVLHTDIADNTLSIWPRFFYSRLARKLFPEVDTFLKSADECNRIIIGKCKDKIASIRDKNVDPDCVLDYFWSYRYDQDPHSDKDLEFTNIAHSIIDLYDAGIDTTNNLLVFCCLLLGRHRDVQTDLRNEIHAVTSDACMINMNMKTECPKIQSFIDEVQRFCYLIPKVYHRPVENCTFRDYQIRSDDIIIGDLATVTRDPTLFENPDKFDPYRFMDKSSTKYVASKFLIPFGLGRRMCLGEKIAMMELFLFLSRMIFRFDIALSKETEESFDDILAGVSGLIHAPLDNKIILKLLPEDPK